MKTVVRLLTVVSVCGVMSAAAAQHSSGGSAPRSSPMGGASTHFSHTHPVLVHTGFHHFHGHRSAVFIDGGFWWGYPYPYYPYPAGYYPQSYEKVGKHWGKDLRKGRVTEDQLVSFLQYDVVRASDRARSDFEVGFLKGYGKEGLAVYTRVLGQAQQNMPRAPTSYQPPSTSPPPADASAAKPPVDAPKYQ